MLPATSYLQSAPFFPRPSYSSSQNSMRRTLLLSQLCLTSLINFLDASSRVGAVSCSCWPVEQELSGTHGYTLYSSGYTWKYSIYRQRGMCPRSLSVGRPILCDTQSLLLSMPCFHWSSIEGSFTDSRGRPMIYEGMLEKKTFSILDSFQKNKQRTCIIST